MKFKMPGEHRFNDVNYNAEINVLCANKVSKEYSNIFNLFDNFGAKSFPYKQFGKGYNKQDALSAEYFMNKLTDLVIVIPIQQLSGHDKYNLFLHYLNHEDWFEATPVPIEEADDYDGQTVKI